MKSRKGFTLVEILVVVAIVAILATLVLVGIGPARTAGQDARRYSDLRQIQAALEIYFNAQGSYPVALPTTDGGSFATPFEGFGELDSAMIADIKIANIPHDPRTEASAGSFGEADTGDYGYYSDGINYLLYAVLDGPAPSSYSANTPTLPDLLDDDVMTCGSDVDVTGTYAPPSGGGLLPENDAYCVLF